MVHTMLADDGKAGPPLPPRPHERKSAESSGSASGSGDGESKTPLPPPGSLKGLKPLPLKRHLSVFDRVKQQSVNPFVNHT